MKHKLSILILVSILFWVFYALFFKVDYWQNHDGDFQLQRAFAAISSIKSGQFPLRWASTLNYGCGLPVFNFFYPLIYYVFSLLDLFKIDIFLSFKIILATFYTIGTFSIFYFVYSLKKSYSGSLIAAILFALNPYFLQLVYVRANPEIITYGLFPLVLLLINKSKYFSLFFVTILYFLSHNTTVLITFPLIVGFCIYLFVKNKKINYFLVFTLLLSCLASSFFLGPAILEKKYVKLGTSIAADYNQHFPTLKQLFISPWGWGYSTSDTNDGMSFKFGYLQWCLLALTLILSIRHRYLLYLSLPLLVCLFMTLPPSKIIWDNLKILHQLQYPWRLLGLSVLLISIISPFTYLSLPAKFRPLFLLFIIIISLVSNRNHIQAVINPNKPDFTRIGNTTIADELLPQGAINDCYHDGKKLSYFPNSYEISQDNKPVDYQECSGYLCTTEGDISTDNIQWHYTSTPIQKIFNYLSLASVVLWLILTFLRRQ
ncbi:MAG TPA: 6-pyruvoyl-tetrahydropterin synthase-related protein [Candidatus Methanoperedens sp.]|nr:6-pyruvoyl-tetrahydropterin synthase-related protein [Candidatus Methanoperedens sp.]